MNRKFLAGFLAASLVLTAAPVVPGMEANADAEELSVGSQTGGEYLNLTGSSRAVDSAAAEIESGITCKDFWGLHTRGVEITENETEISFHSVTNQDIKEGYHNTPSIVGYSGTENKVNGAGYKEYVYLRADNWAWAPEGNKTQAGWSNAGYKMVSNIDNVEFDWGEWLAVNKKGVDCTIKATRTSTGASIEFTDSTVTSITTIPIKDDNNPFYLSITGENCKISEIRVNGVTGTLPSIPEESENPDKPEEPGTPGNPDEPENPDEPGEPDKPGTPSDPGNPDSILDKTYDCEAFWATFTDGMEVTSDGMEASFKSRSKLSATGNYHTPYIVAYTGTENKVNGTGYKEYAVIRSDAWAWGPAGVGDITTSTWEGSGYKFTSEFADNHIDWGTWLAANKSNDGVDCKVSAVKGDGKVTITFINHTVKSVTEIPYSGDEKFFISISGEQCVFGKELPSAEKPKPLAPYPVVLPTPEPTPVPTPAPTLPPADDENSEGIELECGTFWTAWTLGTEVTESGTAVTFKNTTNASATDNWNTPGIVAYSASEPKVNSDGYKEYVYIRADNWAWNPAGDKESSSWTSSGYSMTNNMDSSFDWGTWLAANKAGTDCKVQAIKTDGKIVIETTVAGLTTVTTFPVADGEKVYISLTGEQCKLTNIKTAAYTGIAGVTANPSASATPAPSADPSASPDPAATADPGSTEAPGTTDPGTNPGDKDPGTNNPDSEKPSDSDKDNNDKEDKETKKTMKVSGITAKAGKKKVTGKLSVKGAKVTVKVGSKKAKNAKVNGKKFTFTVSSKLKKGTKVTIKVTKSGYKAVTKTVKVK